MTPRKNALVWRLVIPVVVALAPLSLVAQSGVGQTPDDILKQQTYQTPPKDLADAVLAPRYLNVSLTNASPDKKWFVDEIGDGPVVMKTFSKPFHELGGQFIDFKANRARALTIRNNVAVLSSANFGGDGRCWMVGDGPVDVTIDHNTCLSDGSSAVYAYGEAAQGFVFTNNLMRHRYYGIMGDGTSPGMLTIQTYFPGMVMTGNVLADGGWAASQYPTGQLFPTEAELEAGFLDYAGGDYRVRTTVAWSGSGAR